MVDAERLRRILQRVAGDVSDLRSYRTGDPQSILADPRSLGHIKYLFVTVLEGCIDAAQHVCASEGWGIPETNADAMTLLARRGAIEAALGQSMARAVRFRNILVHGYASVDDRLVVEFLGRLDDLDRFAGALSALIRD